MALIIAVWFDWIPSNFGIIGNDVADGDPIKQDGSFIHISSTDNMKLRNKFVGSK